MSVIALELQRQPPESDSMVELCCEYIEGALAVAILRHDPRTGRLYIGTGRLYPVAHCPFCGARRGPSLVEEDAGPAEFVTVDGVRRCGRCRETGHYARTCSVPR